MEPSLGREPMSPVSARDSGLRRASALTRLIGVGAGALVGGLAGYVAHAKPGRSAATQHQAGAATSGSQPGPSVPSAGSSAPSLAPPAAAPAPAPSSSGIVSGGS